MKTWECVLCCTQKVGRKKVNKDRNLVFDCIDFYEANKHVKELINAEKLEVFYCKIKEII